MAKLEELQLAHNRLEGSIPPGASFGLDDGGDMLRVVSPAPSRFRRILSVSWHRRLERGYQAKSPERRNPFPIASPTLFKENNR